MHPTGRRGRWCTLLCVLLFGLFLVHSGLPEGHDPAAGPPRLSAAQQPGGAPRSLPMAAPLPSSPPRRISLPAIRVDAPLVTVGLDRSGSIEAPPLTAADRAGWYSGAVAPGERGTAVIVGHVDAASGPAVFYLLGSVARGSRVEVLREDGRTAVFEVYGTRSYPQRGFPAEQVYRDGPRPELRLITCGGRYREREGYEDNVVVFARLVEVRERAE
ncbi:class F sortase [Streptomyces sp. NBC_00690]|uniref:class F sortase n=1 Tax=Streptomyces sp. NBC_00690 TaxID=2975808 RepID=UPI003FA70A48